MNYVQPASLTLQHNQLIKMFEDQMKDIFWTEKTLIRALQRMINNATSKVLVDLLKMHLTDTHVQVERLTKVFESIQMKPMTKKCCAMESIIKESEAIIDTYVAGAMCDASIVFSAQKAGHYEIATYGTLCAYAKALGEDTAFALLQQSLEEEKQVDLELSEISEAIYIEETYDEDSDTFTIARIKYKYA